MKIGFQILLFYQFFLGFSVREKNSSGNNLRHFSDPFLNRQTRFLILSRIVLSKFMLIPTLWISLKSLSKSKTTSTCWMEQFFFTLCLEIIFRLNIWFFDRKMEKWFKSSGILQDRSVTSSLMIAFCMTTWRGKAIFPRI